MKDTLFDLTGKRVLITGGGTGLGLGIAKALIRHNANVIIVGRREDILQEACKELGSASAYKVFDLTMLEQIPAFCDMVEKESGPVDALINNAGIHLKRETLEVTDKEFEEVIRTNQTAVFSLTKAFAGKMLKRGKGSIVMISSMAAIYGIPKVIAYTASKAAIEGMTRALAVELSPGGIKINCIAPGFIETNMSAKALNGDQERKAKVLSRTPMGRLGSVDDIGYAAVYLASDASKYVTGIVLPVDGGNSIGF